MQDSLCRLRPGPGLFHALVAAASLGLVGCDDGGSPSLDGKEAIYAEQDDVSVARGGFGVMGDVGAGLPGLSPSDKFISIRSQEARACEQLREDLAYEATEPGFGWQVGLVVPAADLAAGTPIGFAPLEGLGYADSFFHGPDGWIDSGFACEDDPLDPVSPVTGEILSVDGDTVTLRIDNLCFIDYGPILPEDENGEPLEYDDPSDDVLVRADATYTIQPCGSP
jgi:hypothetical protein